MSNFGKRLKTVIDDRGISQKWLADAANTKEATISRYVNGKNNPPVLEILPNIARALNVSSDYLLGLSDVSSSGDSLSQDERMLLACYKKANDKDKKVVWSVLEDYLSSSSKKLLTVNE